MKESWIPSQALHRWTVPKNIKLKVKPSHPVLQSLSFSHFKENRSQSSGLTSPNWTWPSILPAATIHPHTAFILVKKVPALHVRWGEVKEKKEE